MNTNFYLAGVTLLIFLLGCKVSDRSIKSEQYPNFKFGYTTQNFISSTPVSVDNAKKFINYAKEKGFSWIELRDPDASLTIDECREIASFAKENNVEINYSVQKGLLENDFWDVFYKAIENTAIFEGPEFFRALALIGEGEFGWSENEFRQLIETANKAAAIAKEKGMGFTVENADTDIDGYDKPYYGLAEFFEETNLNVTLMLDTANFFTVPTPISPEEVKSFIEQNASRISYLHLKSARHGVASTVLNGNPLDFETIFSLIHDKGVNYIAIELDVVTDEQQVYKNIDTSIDYLVREGLISIK